MANQLCTLLAAAVVILGFAPGPASAQIRVREAAPQISRSDIEAALDCLSLAEGVACTCVVDHAFEAASNLPAVTILNEVRRNRAQNEEIARRIRIMQAIDAGKTACSAPVQPTEGTNARP